MKKNKKKQKRINKFLDCFGIDKNSKIGKITFTEKKLPDWDGHW